MSATNRRTAPARSTAATNPTNMVARKIQLDLPAFDRLLAAYIAETPGCSVREITALDLLLWGDSVSTNTGRTQNIRETTGEPAPKTMTAGASGGGAA